MTNGQPDSPGGTRRRDFGRRRAGCLLGQVPVTERPFMPLRARLSRSALTLAGRFNAVHAIGADGGRVRSVWW